MDSRLEDVVLMIIFVEEMERKCSLPSCSDSPFVNCENRHLHETYIYIYIYI